MEFSIYDDVEKLKIIGHSQSIKYNWINGETFEDIKLEESYQAHLANLPQISVYVISLLKLVFYCFNIFYSNFSTNSYASIPYTSFLAVAIALHSACLLVLTCSASASLTHLKVAKHIIFIIFLSFGIFNIYSIYNADLLEKESLITKNFYLIGFLVYFSYTILLPNSKLTLILVCLAMTSTIVSVELLNIYRNNKPSAFTQEIVCNCCSLIIYYFNKDGRISQRNSFLAKENIKKLFHYYESMVDSLTPQIVCFSEDRIVYENASFKEKVLDFLKSVSDDELISLSKLNTKNEVTNSPIMNVPTSPIRPLHYQSMTDKDALVKLPSDIQEDDSKCKESNEVSLIDQMRKRRKEDNNKFLFVCDKDDISQIRVTNKLRSNILEMTNVNQSFLLIQLYLDNLFLVDEKNRKIKLSDVLVGISTAFSHGSSYVDYNNVVYSSSTSFASLGIFYLSQMMNDSKELKKGVIEKILFFEISFRSFPLKDSYILDVMLNDITKIKHAEKESTETHLRNTLFSKIAHEFKTPLTSIIAINEKMQDALNSKQYTCLPDHINDVNNLSNYTIFLINDIIQYSSRSGNPSIKILKESVDIFSVCSFCLNIQNCLLKSKSIHSSNVKSLFEFDEEIYNFDLVSDETRIKQILLNLISNSVKFTKSGSIKLKAEVINPENDSFISGEQLRSNERVIKLSVSDTGVGIKPEDLKRITKKDDGLIILDTCKEYNKLGSGMGLHIVQTICGLINAKLNISSDYGIGSAFSIYLKPAILKDGLSFSDKINYELQQDFQIPSCQRIKSLSNTARSAYNKESSLAIPKNSYFHTLSDINGLTSIVNCQSEFKEKEQENLPIKPKILIVDDNHTVRKSFTNILQSFKLISDFFQLIECEDGIDMIKLIIEDQRQDNLIKAVFTDESMEYINGSEAIKILKGLEMNSKIKRCFYFSITAFEDEYNMERILNSGADLILSKPASKKQLEEVIELYIKISF